MVSWVCDSELNPGGRNAISAQTACLGEPQWSCVATRMRVLAGVEADRVCAQTD
jgi:hypothetical protein